MGKPQRRFLTVRGVPLSLCRTAPTVPPLLPPPSHRLQLWSAWWKWQQLALPRWAQNHRWGNHKFRAEGWESPTSFRSFSDHSSLWFAEQQLSLFSTHPSLEEPKAGQAADQKKSCRRKVKLHLSSAYPCKWQNLFTKTNIWPYLEYAIPPDYRQYYRYWKVEFSNYQKYYPY